MEVSVRFVFLTFLADSNCNKSLQGREHIDQLEKWRDAGAILFDKSAPWPGKGGVAAVPARRTRGKYPYSVDGTETPEDWKLVERIGELLYPGGPRNANSEDHVESVFKAIKYQRTLITGEVTPPSMPCRILGSTERLERELGVQVVTDAQAVQMVRNAIRQRDDQARRTSRDYGLKLPPWVGQD